MVGIVEHAREYEGRPSQRGLRGRRKERVVRTDCQREEQVRIEIVEIVRLGIAALSVEVYAAQIVIDPCECLGGPDVGVAEDPLP